MKDEFGGEIIEDVAKDEFGGHIVEDAPKRSFVQKAGTLAKTAALKTLGGLDWLSHLGQPQAAKDMVQKIATDPASAPVNPEQAGNVPSFLESFGQMTPGMTMPTLPPGADIRPAASAVADMATSPSTYVAPVASAAMKIPWLAAFVRGAGKAPEAAATAISSKLTHIPGEALTEASTPAGRAGLATAAEGAGGHGSRLAEDLAAFDSKVPEKAIVDKALAAAPPISMKSALDALAKAKGEIPTKSGITSEAGDQAIAKITDMESRLQKGGGKLDADEYRKVRQLLDEDIDWNQTWAKPYSEALSKARKAMKDEMIAAAPLDYADAMKSWHDKIELSEEIKSLIGKEEGARQDIRAQSFLKAASKEPKGGPRRSLLERFDQATGGKHLSESDLLKTASEFGPTGKPGWTPEASPFTMLSEAAAGAGLGHYSGHPFLAALASGAAMAGSSPGIATKLAIPASRIPPYLLRAMAQNSPALSAAGSLPPYLKRDQ